ncbi:hypothetical protein LTR91_019623 [Friedmanniomyces endolithicus]|uniref:Uncharacterized protein n=1 Tax=Friedmanniomyces endolithicus TaxID=329885 RepID=A0AAN6HB42_9PEZI|nr:hypothetical protein LTR75_015777 [Friedmanniomyces endolithicus]KAK0794048.1 hypothetical protein LTR59_007920 [Friedmanniomyces endolithicus]KAK0805811.1 hypothetical protein LTR38_005345 [Friedmanniomyces endolithicus]KAK0848645.1 hypothetical protein LTR03_005656 [Friedmanniomyces endolithicus]KAK0868073.1 hypothetical protein LTS02_003829 [Friedmanniomyces endolithicus]
MPAWEGWSEDAVRQRLPATVPAMTGFTPINAPASTTSDRLIGVAGRGDGIRTHDDMSPIAVASDGLCRGQTEQLPLTASQAPRGPGAKKSKKRASTTNTPHRSKPRKNSNVSDGLVLKKAGTHKDANPGTAPMKKPDINEQAMADTLNLPSPTRKRKRVQIDEGIDIAAQAAPALTRPVRVYANETSMNYVHAGSQNTSLAALKASSKYSATLYNSSQGGSIQQGDVTLARSLLSSPTVPDLAQTSESAHGTAKKRLDDDLSGALGGVGSASRQQLSPVEEEDEFDFMLETLAKSSGAAPVVQTILDYAAETEGQLPTPAPSDAPEQITSVREQQNRKSTKASRPQIQTEEDFIVLDNAEDDAMVDASDIVESIMPRLSPTPPLRDRRQNVRDAQPDDDYGGALLTAAEKDILVDMQANAQSRPKRIVRIAFPASVLDRSPVFGATNSTTLRVCFRVGEALNAGCLAVRSNKDVLLELYARVMESRREEKPGRHQHLVFHDLYHDKPPYLTGTYDLWDQSRLWELDSRVFLKPSKEGVICRAIARMKRDGVKWKLEVLSIWEASREDVENIAGIFVKSGENTGYGEGDE